MAACMGLYGMPVRSQSTAHHHVVHCSRVHCSREYLWRRQQQALTLTFNSSSGSKPTGPHRRLSGGAVSAGASGAGTLVDEAKANDSLFKILCDVKDEMADHIASTMNLQPAVGPYTDERGRATFPSFDGKTEFVIKVSEGKREDNPVLWMVHPAAVVGVLGPSCRLNVYQRSTSYAPNLDIELIHYTTMNKLFVYVNLVPRRSLIDHPSDLKRFYETPAPGGDTSWHDLYLQCDADPAYTPFRTKSAYIRALTGSTGLLYMIHATESDAEGLAKLVRRVTQLWIAAVTAEDVPRPESEAERAALAKTDSLLLGSSRLDPATGGLEKLVGEEGLDRIFALLCREPAVLSKNT